MKIKQLVEISLQMPMGTPGPSRRPEMDVVTSIEQMLPKVAEALRAGKWKYAESLLASMHDNVAKMAAHEEPAPSIEKPRFSI